jgi:regulator of protease activity HflC (stomatin/prohibitin superfamily)
MDPFLAAALGTLALVVVLVRSAIRVVAVGTCAVVTRFGRVTRVATPGLVGLVPGFDRLHRVTVEPHRTEPVIVTAVTRDGFDVRVLASVLWQVHDVRASICARHDATTATADAVEICLQRLVSRRDLVALLADRERLFTDVEAELAPMAAAWGVTILDVAALALELRAAPELLRLLR